MQAFIIEMNIHLSERVMGRTFECQLTKLHVRVKLLNRFTQLGCTTTVALPAMA